MIIYTKGRGRSISMRLEERGKIQPSTEDIKLLDSLGFYTWYVITDSFPGYNINSTCIKQIKAMFQAKKVSKNTHLKGMDEFFQAELEADQVGTVGHGEKPTDESHQKRSQGVMKRTRSQSTKPSSSKKKTRRESVAEVPSKGISSLAIDPEHVHAGSEEDEGSEICLLLRNHRTNGPVVLTVEA